MFRSINWRVAKDTTLFLFTFLGVIYFVSFAFSLKAFWIAPFLVVSFGAWYLFYFLFCELKKRWAHESKNVAQVSRDESKQEAGVNQTPREGLLPSMS